MLAETEARIATLIRVLAGSVILLGLIGTRDVFVGPEARVAGSIFLKSTIFAWGPGLLAVGVVLLLVPRLWTIAEKEPGRILDIGKRILWIGASMLIIPALLAAISFWGQSARVSELLGFLTSLVSILLVPAGLILLFAGGILLHRSATLLVVVATAVLIVVWVVMHRERPLFVRPLIGERSLVLWTPIDTARSNAASKRKLIMYDFSAEWCGPCKLMEREVFNDPRLAATINDTFIPVRVMDRQQEEGRNPSAVEDLERRFAIRSFPTIVFADATLAEADRRIGYRGKADMATLIDDVAHPVLVVPTSVQRLDDFDAPLNWTAYPYAVKLDISQDAGRSGRAMRLDFDFDGNARYATSRKEVDLELPLDYQFSFWIRADAPVNNLEFKLVDPSGKNVWWLNRRDFSFPREWKKITVRKRDVEFAWGPAGGGEPHHISAIEIVVTAGTGGKGTVWIDDLALERLDKEPPKGRASGAAVPTVN